MRRHNLATSLREAIAMAKMESMEDKYHNKWGSRTWPMNDAYCSYANCDFEQTIAVALPGQKCPHCRKPLSWAGKWEVEKEVVGEDGRKRIVRTLEYREPLGKWNERYGTTKKTDGDSTPTNE
jgi:hypothetical protein